ncbi:hypothetical protein [Pseudomonas sp. Marseille-QA0892]
MTEQLKSCPFCGEPARSEPSFASCPDEECPGWMVVADHAEWNRRTEQAATVPDDLIREVFMRNGFTIKEGQTDLKPYVYAAARELLSHVAPPAPAEANRQDERLAMVRVLEAQIYKPSDMVTGTMNWAAYIANAALAKGEGND